MINNNRVTNKKYKKTKKNIHHTGGGGPKSKKPKPKGPTKKGPNGPSKVKDGSKQSSPTTKKEKEIQQQIKKAETNGTYQAKENMGPPQVKPAKASPTNAEEGRLEAEKIRQKELNNNISNFQNQIKRELEAETAQAKMPKVTETLTVPSDKNPNTNPNATTPKAQKPVLSKPNTKPNATTPKAPNTSTPKEPNTSTPKPPGTPKTQKIETPKRKPKNRTKKLPWIIRKAFPSLKKSLPKYYEKLDKLREERELLRRKYKKTKTKGVQKAISTNKQKTKLVKTEMKSYVKATASRDIGALKKKIESLKSMNGPESKHETKKTIKDINEKIKALKSLPLTKDIQKEIQEYVDIKNKLTGKNKSNQKKPNKGKEAIPPVKKLSQKLNESTSA